MVKQLAKGSDPSTRKLIEFDAETWQALHSLALDRMNTVQELADEAFADLLRRHHRPVTLKEALSASAGQQSREKHRKARRKSTHWPPSPRVLRIRFANSISSGVTAFASRASANCSTTA